MSLLARRLRIAAWNRGETLKFALLARLGRLILPGYRHKFPQMDWWRDEDFNAYLARFGELKGHNTDRRWIIHQLLRLIADVPGDTAECGVFQGAGSYLMCKANERDQQHKRHHYMFDSFAGLSRPAGADGSYWQAGDMAVGEELVRANLMDCRDFTLMKGWIPTRFQEVADRHFAFVHIDVDLYEPTRDSLAFFLPRMSPGGIIVVDDYGFTTCPGATRAVEEVLAGAPERMLALPDGGGFLIKGSATAAPARLGPQP